MSPPGGRRCPPALLALLLGLAGSRGLPECRDRAVVTAGSLCLEPDKPSWKWTAITWRMQLGTDKWQKIVTVHRNGTVSYPKGLFHGRATFQKDTLSLCVSPVLKGDSGLYEVEFENEKATFTSLCFRVSVWDPIPPPELTSQILDRDPGGCRLSLLCSSPGNVSYSWACAGDPEGIPEIPEIPEIPGIPSRLIRDIPEGSKPQICVCNVSNAAGWNATRAQLTCPEIPEGFEHWTFVAVAVAVALTLLLASCCCWRKRRRKNSRQEPPGAAEQPLTIYAEVGEKKPRQDPTGTTGATQDGATIYSVVNPRTPDRPRHRQEPENVTVYSTVQLGRRPSSVRRKRLDPALVSTAFLEDNGGYRHLGFPNRRDIERP